MTNTFNTSSLTQEFYQDRRTRTDSKNFSQEVEVKAGYVGWSSSTIQGMGFEVATDLPWLDWKSVQTVLDIGCGHGNLVEYLTNQRLFRGLYTGIDLVPEHIEEAKISYENDYKSRFICENFLEMAKNGEIYDVVISLGVISVNQDFPLPCGEKSKQYVQQVLNEMIKRANVAISLYFPNADNLAISERPANMAFHSTSEIEEMILAASGSRCKRIEMTSFPNSTDIRTIARVELVTHSKG